MSRFLLVDVSFLAYRAYHTTGGLTYHSVGTGVVFGVLREVATLIEWYRPEAVAFCFDSKYSLREEIYPKYKANRREYSGRERKLRQALEEQVTALRKEYLKKIGFRNIFQRRGYEADDLIAFLARELHFGDTAVIVACDHDLYQCLTPNVRMYNPITKKEYTIEDFRREWGNFPNVWARCKAIAGCSSDNVRGVKGVGEKTAMKWIAGKLPDDHRLAKRIVKRLDRVNRNMQLVELPFPGIPCDKRNRYNLRPDRITREKWKAVCESIGIRSVPFPQAEPFDDGDPPFKEGGGYGCSIHGDDDHSGEDPDRPY